MSGGPDAHLDSPPASPSPEPSPPRGVHSGKAVVSFVLGLLSIVLCLQVFTGIPALLLGYVSLRQINESDGRLLGARWAVAGMILGGIGTFLPLLILVAGILANVLLNVREQAERTECQNNERQIGMAVSLYETKEGHYPQAILPNPNLGPGQEDRHLSWLVSILPFLDPVPEPGVPKSAAPPSSRAAATYERLDLNQPWDVGVNREAAATRLSWFHCPSVRHPSEPGSPALTDYVGFSGLGPDAARLPAADPRAGFFGDERVLTRAQVVDARGQSQTVMAAETAHDNGPWAAGGEATVRDLDPQQQPYSGPGRPFGGCHPGGFYVLFADGSVVFFRDTVDPKTLEALVPITGAAAGP